MAHALKAIHGGLPASTLRYQKCSNAPAHASQAPARLHQQTCWRASCLQFPVTKSAALTVPPSSWAVYQSSSSFRFLPVLPQSQLLQSNRQICVESSLKHRRGRRGPVVCAAGGANSDYKVYIRELSRSLRGRGVEKAGELPMTDPAFGPALPEGRIPPLDKTRMMAMFELLNMAKEGEVQEFVYQETDPSVQLAKLKAGEYVRAFVPEWAVGDRSQFEEYLYKELGGIVPRVCPEPMHETFDQVRSRQVLMDRVNVAYTWLLAISGLYVLGWTIVKAYKEQYVNRKAGGMPGDQWEALEFAKSKADARKERKTGITLADVAGIQGIVDELREIVSYLKAPHQFDAVGCKPPQGVLLEGPPGTGKTLMAKALAGEADVPFYSVTGSEFVEMIVGVGAARIRDLFARARFNAPAIIFVDEIDALAGWRSAGGGYKALDSGLQEREQTLNQLLTELDGFTTDSGIVFIGATNRMGMLDPAILRPGRLDRKIRLGYPNDEGRLEVLQVHAKKTKMDPNLDLRFFANNLPGFSGADLAQLVNEAALMAVRRQAQFIERQDMDKALDRVITGTKKAPLPKDLGMRRRISCHELGHALLSVVHKLNGTLQIEQADRVSLEARGTSWARTVFARLDDDHYSGLRKPQLLQRMQSILAGRAAEEVVFGRDVSSYGGNDVQAASWLARKILVVWNLDPNLVVRGEANPFPLSARGARKLFVGPVLNFEGGLYKVFNQGKIVASEEVKVDVDARTEALVNQVYQDTVEMLRPHRAALQQLIELLVNGEELRAAQMEAVVSANWPEELVVNSSTSSSNGSNGNGNLYIEAEDKERTPVPKREAEPEPVRIGKRGDS